MDLSLSSSDFEYSSSESEETSRVDALVQLLYLQSCAKLNLRPGLTPHLRSSQEASLLKALIRNELVLASNAVFLECSEEIDEHSVMPFYPLLRVYLDLDGVSSSYDTLLEEYARLVEIAKEYMLLCERTFGKNSEMEAFGIKDLDARLAALCKLLNLPNPLKLKSFVV